MASDGAFPSSHNTSAPNEATVAVLRPSDPIAKGAREVKGINFDEYAGRNVTVSELVAGMTDMGFQASAVGDAVRIIDNMVCSHESTLQKPTKTSY